MTDAAALLGWWSEPDGRLVEVVSDGADLIMRHPGGPAEFAPRVLPGGPADRAAFVLCGGPRDGLGIAVADRDGLPHLVVGDTLTLRRCPDGRADHAVQGVPGPPPEVQPAAESAYRKTRLAQHFGRLSADTGWQVRVAYPDDPAAPAAADPLLVLVGYAERWALDHLLGMLGDVAGQDWSRIRFLLLARPAGLWWYGLAHRLEESLDVSAEAMPIPALAGSVQEPLHPPLNPTSRAVDLVRSDDTPPNWSGASVSIPTAYERGPDASRVISARWPRSCAGRLGPAAPH